LAIAPGAKVIVMPAAEPPLKLSRRMFPFNERFRRLREMFAAEIQGGRVLLSVLEKKLPAPNYTIQTLKALESFCVEKPVIVIGADQATKISEWHSAAQLMSTYEFVVFARRGTNAVFNGFNPHVIADFDEAISSTEIRAGLSR